jgi:hypothetical protein
MIHGFRMRRYKRNQVEEAVPATLRQMSGPGPDVHSQIKRLLDADRALAPKEAGRSPGYAFFSGTPPGRGFEVWFSAYESFAVLTGVRLLHHGWPQGTAVRIMRQARPALEKEHARILAQDINLPLASPDTKAEPGAPTVYTQTADAVCLALITADRRKSDEKGASYHSRICRGEREVMQFWRERAPAGMSMTVLELSASVHLLSDQLQSTEPRARGR